MQGGVALAYNPDFGSQQKSSGRHIMGKAVSLKKTIIQFRALLSLVAALALTACKGGEDARRRATQCRRQ